MSSKTGFCTSALDNIQPDSYKKKEIINNTNNSQSAHT